jgi:hypothetical protein
VSSPSVFATGRVGIAVRALENVGISVVGNPTDLANPVRAQLACMASMIAG